MRKRSFPIPHIGYEEECKDKLIKLLRNSLFSYNSAAELSIHDLFSRSKIYIKTKGGEITKDSLIVSYAGSGAIRHNSINDSKAISYLWAYYCNKAKELKCVRDKGTTMLFITQETPEWVLNDIKKSFPLAKASIVDASLTTMSSWMWDWWKEWIDTEVLRIILSPKNNEEYIRNRIVQHSHVLKDIKIKPSEAT